MNYACDQPGSVRPGEELDAEAVGEYLRGVIPGLTGSPGVRQYRGGASNLTYEVSFGSDAFVLRRPPFGTKAKSAHDMGREFRIQKLLGSAFPYVPETIVYCSDESVIGSEFYVMKRLNGIILRADFPKDLELDRGRITLLCRHIIDCLIELHQVDTMGAGLGEIGKGEGYVRRQIDGWSRRFRDARTDNVPDFEEVMAWLDANVRDDAATCVIHNDFRFDNIVLDPGDPTKVIGILDWEMATVGDPLMDLGNSLAYWIESTDEPLLKMMRRQPTHLPGMMTRNDVIAYYSEQMGFGEVDFGFYRIYGLFRLAVIIQQIYYRFHHGQTSNPEFAGFYRMVSFLDGYCRRTIESQEGLKP